MTINSSKSARNLDHATRKLEEYPSRIPSRLGNCISCHGGRRVSSINSRFSRFTRHLPIPVFKEGDPVEIGQATAAKKQDEDNWKALQDLWRTEDNDESSEKES